MSFSRAASVFALLALASSSGSLVACSGAGGDPAPGAKPGADAGADTKPVVDSGPTPEGVADPAADPVPAGLPALSARASEADLPADLSCFGQAQPVGIGKGDDREVHIVELGGTDNDRVAGAKAELFFSNVVSGTPDLVGVGATPENADQKAKAGTFNAAIPAGFIAVHFPLSEGHIETIAFDLDTRPAGFISATVAPSSTVEALSSLIGGIAYKPTPGAGRLVVRAVDCADLPLANAHVTIEVDGVVPAMVTTSDATGIRKSYFGDAELPGPGKWTSRSGVVAFLDVPNGKALRLVVRGKPDAAGAVKVLGIRKLPIVVDGVVTAKISPFKTP